jgi:hypothetical protein
LGLDLEFLIGLITAIATVVGGISTFLYRKRVEDVTRKRQTCAEALGALLEWLEIPYRIRRRQADAKEIRHELANLIHGLQVRIDFYRAWLEVEAPKVADSYEDLNQAIKGSAGPAIQEAWKQPGVSEDSQMNVGSLGEFDIERPRREFVEAVRREIKVWRWPWES